MSEDRIQFEETPVFDANNAWLRDFLIEAFYKTTSKKEKHQIVAALGSLKTFVESTDTTSAEYQIHEDSRNHYLALYAPERYEAELYESESETNQPFISL